MTEIQKRRKRTRVKKGRRVKSNLIILDGGCW